MTKKEIQKILSEHKRYVNGKEGKKANLHNADLSGVNLSKANLFWADLTHANLRGADLSEANLMFANLTKADLTNANLKGANLFKANLMSANLSEADLTDSMLCEAYLYGAVLKITNGSIIHLDMTDPYGKEAIGVKVKNELWIKSGDYYKNVPDALKLWRARRTKGRAKKDLETARRFRRAINDLIKSKCINEEGKIL